MSRTYRKSSITEEESLAKYTNKHLSRVRIFYRDYDHNEEVEFAAKKYKRYNRDGRFYEGNLNHSYKKYCAQEMRRLNRELARKIIKDDDSWEQKPYPDTYLGKMYVWDYW